MKNHRGSVRIFVVGAAIVGFISTSVFAGSNDLTIGDQAPAFELMGSDGETHSLADHYGERVVVLAWFPKAFTGG